MKALLWNFFLVDENLDENLHIKKSLLTDFVFFNLCFMREHFLPFDHNHTISTKRSICAEVAIAWKVSKYEVIFGVYFHIFRLNTETYSVNVRIQSEYRKIRTRNNSILGHFSCSVYVYYLQLFGMDNISNWLEILSKSCNVCCKTFKVSINILGCYIGLKTWL